MQNDFDVEASKPIDYNTLMLIQIAKAAESLGGDIIVADKLIRGLRSLILPYADARYRSQEKQLTPVLIKARMTYYSKWGADRQKVELEFVDAVQQQFEYLISCAERVHLLGGKRPRKTAIYASEDYSAENT